MARPKGFGQSNLNYGLSCPTTSKCPVAFIEVTPRQSNLLGLSIECAGTVEWVEFLGGSQLVNLRRSEDNAISTLVYISADVPSQRALLHRYGAEQTMFPALCLMTGRKRPELSELGKAKLLSTSDVFACAHSLGGNDDADSGITKRRLKRFRWLDICYQHVSNSKDPATATLRLVQFVAQPQIPLTVPSQYY